VRALTLLQIVLENDSRDNKAVAEQAVAESTFRNNATPTPFVTESSSTLHLQIIGLNKYV